MFKYVIVIWANNIHFKVMGLSPSSDVYIKATLINSTKIYIHLILDQNFAEVMSPLFLSHVFFDWFKDSLFCQLYQAVFINCLIIA